MIVLGKGIFLKSGILKVIKSGLILYTYISQQKLRCDPLTKHPPTDDRNKYLCFYKKMAGIVLKLSSKSSDF